MKALFLQHQQRRDYREEPGYQEVFQVFLRSGLIADHAEYVWQSAYREHLKQVRGRFSQASGPEICTLASASYEREFLGELARHAPDLLVYICGHAYTGVINGADTPEALHPVLFRKAKQLLPRMKIYAQLFDFNDDLLFTRGIERGLMMVSDFVGFTDNRERVEKIRDRIPPYEDYQNAQVAHFHTTVADSSHFHPRPAPKEVDILILGSAESYRGELIEFLRATYGGRFLHRGGIFAQDDFVPLEEYARLMAAARIYVNSQTVMSRIQVKGKVKEALASGTFLLEQDNQESRAFLDGSGVVFYDGHDDLCRKIDYFLAHGDEREAIAARGHAWYRERYSEERFVRRVLDSLELT